MTETGWLPIVGSGWTAFLCVNIVLGAGAAWITGRVMATTWKPLWHVLAYCFLLALATRFLLFALFGADLLSLPGLLFSLAVIGVVGMLSFRVNRSWKMITQYPWLYERAGLLGWRSRHSSIDG